ncbi:hypothetical protein BKA63DRAFT_551456 [Paraphoma chrysanthemicola]|nr:hypothetical protein BKA63DRAFT_551456 [Paraphoma chrysanthemicola]
MHISKLPTELDINIARFIDTKHHVSALSQISKFYRNDVAEPLLYGTFVFDVRDRRTNYQFLLALLQRPELALHINSMRINTHRETLGSLGFVLFKESTTDQKKQIWFLNSVISKLISSIMCTELETDESIELQNRLLGGLYMHEVSDNRDETVLALILCMATNVEALEVCSQHYCLRTIGLVLQFPWTNTDTQPLSRLKHMHQCCCTGLPGILDLLVYPAMQTARVCNGKAWRTPWLGLIKSVSMPKIPKLLTLEFIKVAVDPLRISKMIMLEASSVANLNTLLVQDCDKPQSGGSLRIRNQDNDDDDDDDEERQAWNMPNLVKTLSEHVPKLESFTWSHQPFLDSRTVPFDDFTALSSLKSLTVDDKFLSLDAKANLFTNRKLTFHIRCRS